MKIKDILKEGVTDIVARFYKEAGDDFDSKFNPEHTRFKALEKEYYKTLFTDGSTPIFSTPNKESGKKFTTTPSPKEIESAGFRGLQRALKKSGHDTRS